MKRNLRIKAFLQFKQKDIALFKKISYGILQKIAI